MVLDEGIPVITALDVQRTVGNAAVAVKRHLEGKSGGCRCCRRKIYIFTESIYGETRTDRCDA